jgi:hypothetical protein
LASSFSSIFRRSFLAPAGVNLAGDVATPWSGYFIWICHSCEHFQFSLSLGDIGCSLMLYVNLFVIWQAESKSDTIESMDCLSCFLLDVNSASRIQDATWKCTFTISVFNYRWKSSKARWRATSTARGWNRLRSLLN